VPERLKRVLLGPEEYEVVMRNGAVITAEILPHGVTLSRQENGHFVFQIDQPQATIPVLLKSLLDHHLPVLSCAPVPRSLEEAYLRAVSLHEENGNESN